MRLRRQLRGFGAATYPVGEESIILAGSKRGTRTRVCASQKRNYAWQRIDPCIEYREDALQVEPIRSSRDTAKLATETFLVGSTIQESVWVISLDVRNRPLGWEEVARGSRSAAIVDRVIVLQSPLLLGATAFILLHNHPSEAESPSDEDVRLTREVSLAAKHVGMRFLDHIILTRHDDRYFSFLDAGLMPT